MTRINCIPPVALFDKHLVAEYRELPRVFSLAGNAYDRGEDPATFPDTYCLGQGHVKFFYAKQYWLRNRYFSLRREMVARGFEVNVPVTIADKSANLPDGWQGDWTPDAEAQRLNRNRILERIKPQWTS